MKRCLMLLAGVALLGGCSAWDATDTKVAELPQARAMLPLGVDDGGSRASWSTTRLIYPGGRVRHPVNYFDDIGPTDHDPMNASSSEGMLRRAMAGEEPALWSAEQALDTVLQPASFGVDVAMLPVRALFYRPWELAVSPAER
ncbi:MAG: hypothetical protein RIG82_03915 [Phycisphaeraceae bacterium]